MSQHPAKERDSTARVIQRAIDSLGDENRAREWLKRPNRALLNESPLDLLGANEGPELVADELWVVSSTVISIGPVEVGTIGSGRSMHLGRLRAAKAEASSPQTSATGWPSATTRASPSAPSRMRSVASSHRFRHRSDPGEPAPWRTVMASMGARSCWAG